VSKKNLYSAQYRWETTQSAVEGVG